MCIILSPNFRALDYGAGVKRRIHDMNGPAKLPKTSKGLNSAEKFAEEVNFCLNGDSRLDDSFPGADLIFESATVGASGAEPEQIRDIAAASTRNIYVISSRAVKNFKRRHGINDLAKADRNLTVRDILRAKGIIVSDNPTDDDLSAAIIYHLAAENPARLKKWRYVSKNEKFHRSSTTVRPWDKREYAGAEPDRLMHLLPNFWDLPEDMKEVWGLKNTWCRSRVIPFAQALEEKGADTRNGYEHILGLYGHGYPSHYRRATEDLRQYIAKKAFGVKHIDDLTVDQHKASLRTTRYYIRRLYHLAQGKSDPAMGNRDPVSRFEQLKGNQEPEKGMAHPSLFFFEEE